MIVSLLCILAGCYDNHTGEPIADFCDTIPQSDSVYTDISRQVIGQRRPYTLNYNFLVMTDSLTLCRRQPSAFMGEMITADTVTVYKGDRVVVADVCNITADTVDTVWVKIARDEAVYGWLHETRLLDAVVPDDPISLFICTFSNTHLLITLVFICVIAVAYLLRHIFSHKAKIVHFNDIHSAYPTALALLVASSATLYSSIQMFAPTAWQYFYYYPTLNPFAHSMMPAMFLVSVWAIIIMTIAVTDVVLHMLPLSEALLYLCALAGICAIVYIVFSISTLYYVGYPLLVLYYVFAIRRYLRRQAGS